MKKVSVAILSWNGRQHLEICLGALREQQDPGVAWEILVLDNGSVDGTVDWVRANHPEVQLISSPVNLGFCAGNQRLVEAANGDAIALLNNDTRPQPQWLGELVAALASAPDDVAAVSGQIVNWEGDHLDFGRGLMTFDGHAFQRSFGWPLDRVNLPAAGEELFFACGGNMLVRKSSFLAAGGFDPSYFAYLEDVDLGWRLWSGGERIVFAPQAVVHHRSMATSDMLGNYHRGFLFERNAYLTAYKNFDSDLWPRLMPAIQLTLTHRTQTLLVQNNPAGEQLTFDPYAGMIANTAAPTSTQPTCPADGAEKTERVVEGDEGAEAPLPETSQPEISQLETSQPEATPGPGLVGKWRQYGSREFVRRGWRKAVRLAAARWLDDSQALPEHVPQLTDGRTIAQLRAITYVLGHLDESAAERKRVQARRKRSDLEIFERFPLAIVPTYPGDERLFSSPGFKSWLPENLPLERLRLDEIVWTGED